MYHSLYQKLEIYLQFQQRQIFINWSKTSRLIKHLIHIQKMDSQTPKQQIKNEHQFNQNQINIIEPTFVHKVEVKSRLTGTSSKTLEILPHSNKLIVYSSQRDKSKGKGKQFPLNQVTFTHQNNYEKGKSSYLHIDTNNSKKYSVKSDNSTHIANDIQKGQNLHKISQSEQQPQSFLPNKINYMTLLQGGLGQFQNGIIPLEAAVSTKQQNQLSNVQAQLKLDANRHPKRKWFFNPEDWVLDTKKGGIRFINQEKKKNQTKIVKFILKKFLTSGSFMGISFPTFAMKPESILQSYSKAVGAAPIFLQNVTNPVQRMKKFVCFIHTFSVLFADMMKPFNPPLGQTFQAKIADGLFYAQQICHHPPVSAFLYEGKDYKLSGSLQMSAKIGANSATGLFVGDLELRFADGSTLKGKIPGGQFSGFMIGDNKFQTYGSIYCYDNKKLVCSMSTAKKNNFFEGFIGKLKPKHQQQFFAKVQSPDRFEKFPFYQRKCFEVVYSFMQMVYNVGINFDGKEYLNLAEQKYLPFLPQQIPKPNTVLQSDCRLRKDIPLLKQLKFDESQQQKQKIEDQQRYFRKLRQKYDPLHHKNH